MIPDDAVLTERPEEISAYDDMPEELKPRSRMSVDQVKDALKKKKK